MNVGTTRLTMEDFWDRVEPWGDCLEWLGPVAPAGYGTFGSARLAHRVAYETLIGPIPEGKQLDHLCRNRRCVNPPHLEPVTVRENVLRGIGRSAANARKTHCKHGHEFTPENTYMFPDGSRHCRVCRRDTRLRWDRTHPELVKERRREQWKKHHR